MDAETEALPGIHKRLTALEKSVAYGNTQVEDVKREQALISNACRRIEATFASYEAYLKESIESQKFWFQVRDEVIKGVAKSAVWAVIVAFCAALWYAFKAYAKELLGG